MAMFDYSGRDRSGQKVSGRLDAKSLSEAQQVLRLMGVSGARLKSDSGSSSGSLQLPPFLQSFFEKKTASDSDLVTFTKQLSVMIDAGVSVIKSLEILENQATNPAMVRAIASVRGQVERGLELGDALEKNPKIFDQLYCSLVRAGTASGQLDVILKRLSGYIEKNAKLKRQLFGAMFYPAMVIGIAVALTIFMLVVIVPILASTFLEAGQELPGLTVLVIDASQFLQDQFLVILGVIFGGGFLFKKWISTADGRYRWDTILLKIPLVGTLIQKISIARFASTTATLVSSGVGITDVLLVSSKVLGNKVLEESITRVREGVIQGKGMGVPLGQESHFPKMVTSMISIGETSGQLDTMLEKVSDFYEEEVDAALSALLKAIEPIMFVVIGCIVGVILIAMYLPVFDLASAAG
jgi:type IV pilus assembly protein PilC